MRTVEEVFNDRTCYKFSNKEVSAQLLQKIYDTMKLGPTSANCCPLRILFVTSSQEREKLAACAMDANAERIKACPVIAIFAYDMKFYELLPKLFPHNIGMKDYFSSDPEIIASNAMRNSTLQAAYFIMIARSHGLDCGPMSGFNAEAVKENYYDGKYYKVKILCNIGYREGANEYPRSPRLEFAEACKII